MSTPPPNYPPPQGYGAPPPPQNSGGGGCFKAAGITCLVLIVLVAIGGFMMYNWVKNTGLVGQSMQIGVAAQQGLKIQQAVVKYKNDTGNYPTSITVLVPKYLLATDLHSTEDPNQSPAHVSWTYIRPGGSSTGKSALLVLPYTMKINVMGQSTVQNSQIIINLDGTTSAGASSGGGFGGSGSQSPFGGGSTSGGQ